VKESWGEKKIEDAKENDRQKKEKEEE